MKKDVRREHRMGDRLAPIWMPGYEVVETGTHTATITNSATQKVLRTISLAHIKPVRDRQSSSSACVSDLVHIEHDHSYTDVKTVTTPIPALKKPESKNPRRMSSM